MAICDLGLPGSDGLELIPRLRRQAPEIAIVVATGISDTRTAGAATELGAFGYLIKPFDQNQLLITVENALHRRQLEIGERRRQDELEGMVDERGATADGLGAARVAPGDDREADASVADARRGDRRSRREDRAAR